MNSRANVAAFILAGGKSTRMGTDKAFVQLKGRTLLDWMLETARAVTTNVAIVGSATKYSVYAPVIDDLFADCGPLAGIHAALQASSSDLNLVLAVDLPFITAPLLEVLLTKATETPTALITVPRTSQGWQPLCAVYRRDFRQIAEQSLRAGHYKIDPLFEPNRARTISEEDLNAAGFSARVFQNLNSPEDLVDASQSVLRRTSGSQV